MNAINNKQTSKVDAEEALTFVCTHKYFALIFAILCKCTSETAEEEWEETTSDGDERRKKKYE